MSGDWERRTNIVGYFVLTFVAGWVCCQSYYNLSGLWNQRNALVKEVVTIDNNCRNLRQIAIRHMIEQQDEGLAPDWGSIKPCPKVTIPKK